MNDPIRDLPIAMHAVDGSSNIGRIGYDSEHCIMDVEFKKPNGPGDRYRYKNVPSYVWDAFFAAPSKGSFLAVHIKGKFEAIKFKPEAQK